MKNDNWLKSMLWDYVDLMGKFRKKNIYITKIEEERNIAISSKSVITFTLSWGLKELEELLKQDAKYDCGDYVLEMESGYGLIKFVEDEYDYEEDYIIGEEEEEWYE